MSGYPVQAEILRDRQRPATESQLRTLREMGLTPNPTTMTRIEASQIIAEARDLKLRKDTIKQLYKRMRRMVKET